MATEESMMLLLPLGLVLLQLLFRFVLSMPLIQAIANGSGRNSLRLMFPPPLVLKLFPKPLLLALHATHSQKCKQIFSDDLTKQTDVSSLITMHGE